MAKLTPAQMRHQLHCRIVEMIGGTMQTAIPAVVICVVAICTYLSIDRLAGRFTFAQIGLSVLGDLKISESLLYLFGSGGIAYGWRQRGLKGDNIERTAKRIADLEARLDPNRSSSRLTPRGHTRPEDRK